MVCKGCSDILVDMQVTPNHEFFTFIPLDCNVMIARYSNEQQFFLPRKCRMRGQSNMPETNNAHANSTPVNRVYLVIVVKGTSGYITVCSQTSLIMGRMSADHHKFESCPSPLAVRRPAVKGLDSLISRLLVLLE